MKSFLLILALCFLLCSLSAYPFAGGNGTQNSPYQISTKAHLELLADSVNNIDNWSAGKYFIVMNDITDSVRTVIGNTFVNDTNAHVAGKIYENYTIPRAFQGDFNGNNKKITLAISGDAYARLGLFGYTSGANIVNLTVDGIVRGGIYNYNGGIIAVARNTTISHCINYASISAVIPLVSNGGNGGIVGLALQNSVISYCTNHGSVTHNSVDGGIVGWCEYITISNCINNGYISTYVDAGIAARTWHSVVTNCLNLGTIIPDSSGYFSGGVCGNSDEDSEVYYCINAGYVGKGGNRRHGGIMAETNSAYKSSIIQCLNVGVTGNDRNARGIIGG